MMAILSPARPTHQAGFTLLEMMAALAIGAALAAGLASLSRTVSPRIEFRSQVEQIARDLDRARLHARRSGQAVDVIWQGQGYQIDPLAIDQPLVGYEWRLSGPDQPGAPARLRFLPNGFSGSPRTLVLVHDGFEAHLAISPSTSRITVEIADA